MRTTVLCFILLLLTLPTLAADKPKPEGGKKAKERRAQEAEPVPPPGPQILLPLGRSAYQTNERVDLAYLRYGTEALPAGTLELQLSGPAGSAFETSFPVEAVPAATGAAQRTEHFRLDARLLRPGAYVATIRCDGATQQLAFDIHSHIRKTSFRIIDWGGSGNGADQVRCGEEGTGINLMLASAAGHDQSANIRGGMDYMRNCTMGGGHQMDLNRNNDWSDPYVLTGGMARVARQALRDRTSGNTIGVHFYDEPGLTWLKHHRTGIDSPNNIPSQDWAYKATLGEEPVQYDTIDPLKPADVDAWERVLRQKQVYLEAGWRMGRFAVEWVDPRLLSATQSMYGWLAYGDGYYFNVTRSLPINSGHGGYDDLAGGFLAPGFFYEFGRMRDYAKPAWYLPHWWDQTASPLFRLEQYLTFMTGVQGIAIPPGTRTESPGTGNQDDGMLESNRLMARLGTIFHAMPLTRPHVAILYSMSQNALASVRSENLMLTQDFPGQVERLLMMYVAGKMAHQPLFPIVEEDVLDGTLAANHRAVILTGIERLDSKVVTALTAYAVAGGHVWLTDDCKIDVPGSRRLGAETHTKIYEEAQRIVRDETINPLLRRNLGCAARSAQAYYRACGPLAEALKQRCVEAGIAPVLECDHPHVFATRHAQGDVEYFFLANANSDNDEVKEGRFNATRPARAKVALPHAQGALYDAVRGGPASEFTPNDGKLTADLRFGTGQMRVFARTARPIGAVQVFTPLVRAGNYAFDHVPPVALELQAVVLDDRGQVLNGAIPLSVRVTDPLGDVRFDLFRSTEQGVLRIQLPLGVNDASGTWRVAIKELLNQKEGEQTFVTQSPAQCGALLGATRRAVYLPADEANMFRFFRLHRSVALVVGNAEYHKTQAERLAGTLARWNIACTVVPAASLKKKERNAEMKKTWPGAPGHPDLDMPGEAAILFGAPEDDTLIAAMCPTAKAPKNLAPYTPLRDCYPGRGRGMLAWQVEALAYSKYESIACIAYDAEGMAEAVGTLCEIANGYRAATDTILPGKALLKPAHVPASLAPALRIERLAALPDRADYLQALPDSTLLAASWSGWIHKLKADGSFQSEHVLPGATEPLVAANAEGTVWASAQFDRLTVFKDAGEVVFETPLRFLDPRLRQIRPSPASVVAVSADGSLIAAGTESGHLRLWASDGQERFAYGGANQDEYDKYSIERKAFMAVKAERDAKLKLYKEEMEVWIKADAAWQQAPAETRGARPKKPAPVPKGPQAPRFDTPEPCHRLIFSADGSRLLASFESYTIVVDTRSGKLLAELADTACARPDRIGDEFVLLTQAGELALLTADGAVTSTLRVLPEGEGQTAKPGQPLPDTLLGVWPIGDGALVASHQGRVWRFKKPSGEGSSTPLWEDRYPDRLVKFVAPGASCAAVAYWGGTVRLLDGGTGKLLASHTFEQDVAALAGTGSRWTVVLADGRVYALSAP
ncbi:MAG: hypothetical protein AMXMBFR7_43500 [Planctomycetota bacterium]